MDQLGHFLGEAVQRRPREQVVQGDHRVGLAATKVGLQLNDGITALLAKATYCVEEQFAQAVSQE
ncbi:MAG: hypothetical protein ACRDZ8_17805, partial [Acidimicrobiales bacterium]